jgi:hypothetical protein
MNRILGLFRVERLEDDALERVPDAIIPDRTVLPNLRLEIARIITSPSCAVYRRFAQNFVMFEHASWRRKPVDTALMKPTLNWWTT